MIYCIIWKKVKVNNLRNFLILNLGIELSLFIELSEKVLFIESWINKQANMHTELFASYNEPNLHFDNIFELNDKKITNLVNNKNIKIAKRVESSIISKGSPIYTYPTNKNIHEFTALKDTVIIFCNLYYRKIFSHSIYKFASLFLYHCLASFVTKLRFSEVKQNL